MTPAQRLFGDRVAPDGSLMHENFAAWFRDSVMVDASGLPMVLFHGTNSDFGAFKVGSFGIFFAEDPDVANSFASIRQKFGSPRVLPVFLRIQRPWTLITYPADYPYSRMIDQSSTTIIAQGYDACFRPGDGAWIVFSPNQVKSRFNSGLFSRESEDIADARPLRMESADLGAPCTDETESTQGMRMR